MTKRNILIGIQKVFVGKNWNSLDIFNAEIEIEMAILVPWLIFSYNIRSIQIFFLYFYTLWDLFKQ